MSRYIIAVVLAVTTSLLSVSATQAQSPPPPTIPLPKPRATDPVARAYFELGKQLFYVHELDASIDNLQKSLKRMPDVGEVYVFLGLAQKQKKLYAAAEESLRKALTDPELPKQRVYTVLGGVLVAAGEYKKAEAELRKAYDADTKNPIYANNLAYVYSLQSTNLEEALQLVTRAVEVIPVVDPGRGYLLDTRAWVYYQLNRYDEAENDAVEAIRIAEKYDDKEGVGNKHYHLGEIYVKKNKVDLARREFEKALQLDKSNKGAVEALRRLR